MSLEVQKITKIADVLMSYLMTKSKKVSVSIEEKQEKYIINIESEQTSLNNDEIDKLSDLLNVTRQKEMEEYYWHLIGNDDKGEEINLVGMMIDESKIYHKHSSLKITLIRNK